eukprot:Lithocolla_globosa_v1_NODE_229_length_4989_cov_24.775030.p1 type:complete len:684 gc:universal NODE_229_length_4989_cov_24.775030:4600-2549(-)
MSVSSQLEDLYKYSKEYCQAILTGFKNRDYSSILGYGTEWSGSVLQQHTKQGGMLSKPTGYPGCLGGDGIQPFGKVVDYSITILGLKDMRLGISDQAKIKFQLFYTAIPGPRQPKSLDPYVTPLVDEFTVFFTGKPGRWILDEETREFQGLVVILDGDHPFICKSCGFCGVGAFKGCFRCNIVGVHNARNRGMYSPGYSAHPGDNTSQNSDSTCCADSWDRREDLQTRIEMNLVKSKHCSSKRVGLNPPTKLSELPAWNVVNTPRLDGFHTFLEDIVKKFWKDYALQDYKLGEQCPPWAMPKDLRKLFSTRIMNVIPTSDFGRKPRDVVNHGMLGEEWLAFTLIYSEVCAQGCLPPRMMEMWSYFCRGFRLIYSPYLSHNDRKAGFAFLRKFAEIGEDFLGIEFCTMSLHIGIIEGDKQIDLYGAPYHWFSSWVERFVQHMIRMTKYRVTRHPEVTMTNDYLMERHMFLCEDDIPKIDEIMKNYNQSHQQSIKRYRRQKNVNDENVFPGFIGKGQDAVELTQTQWESLITFVSTNKLVANPEEGELMLSRYCDSFHRATAGKKDFPFEVHAETYTTVRTRCSTRIAVTEPRNEHVKIKFANVKRFFRIKFGTMFLRVAYIEYHDVVDPIAIGHSLDGYPQVKRVPAVTQSFVLLSMIIKKVIFFEREDAPDSFWVLPSKDIYP